MIVVDVRPGGAERLHEPFVDGRKGRAQVDARRDRGSGLEQQAQLPVLGVEAVDDAGALDGDSGLGGQPGGKGLVGLGEAPRMTPLYGAEKADDLVAGDDRHVHDGALTARDHLGPLFGGKLEIVVVRRGDAVLGGCSGARPDVAQAVDRPGPLVGGVVGRLVAGDDLHRSRRLLADEHVAMLDLETLGKALCDVDERAFGRPAADDAANLRAVFAVGRRLGGRTVLGESARVGRRLGDDRADALSQHELGGRVAPLPVAGEQFDHADALAAQHERQRQPAALDLGGRTARPLAIRRARIRRGEQRFSVADHASRGGVGGEVARAAHGRAHAADVVAGHRFERVATKIDERKHGGGTVHRAQQTGADQRQAAVGTELVDRAGRGVDQRQQGLGPQLLSFGIDEKPLGGMLVLWSTSHPASPHTFRAGRQRASRSPHGRLALASVRAHCLVLGKSTDGRRN